MAHADQELHELIHGTDHRANAAALRKKARELFAQARAAKDKRDENLLTVRGMAAEELMQEEMGKALDEERL